MTEKPMVYLAGPAALHPAARALFDYLKEVCAQHGLHALTPADGDGAILALPQAVRASAIRDTSLARLRQSQAVIACISPFRGPGACARTAFEMGVAEGLGLPVIAWSEDKTPLIARIPHDRDQDGRVFCRQHGMGIEDFDLPDTIMLAAGRQAVQSGFEDAVKLAARILKAADE